MSVKTWVVEDVIYKYGYYEGYLLDGTFTYELTQKQKNILDNAIMLVENKLTLRQLSRECLVPKSTLQRDFKELRKLSYELYQCVQRRYKINIDTKFRGLSA